ncbi:MAG: hypothetical protein H0T68_06695 [Gemmatimonadales bacterium]|nr:hypothetical protein [Gemmatimonadales bacterium]
MPRAIIMVLVGTLFLLPACQDPTSMSQSSATPAFARAPATGNGHKFVELIDEDAPAVDCEAGEFLDLHFGGWIQFRVFDEPVKRNVELDVFHVVGTFTNTAGETFLFRDIGPEHYYLDDGNLIVASSGRFGGGLIGHIVTNLTTGETEFIAGKEFAGAEALACEALT